MSLQERPVLVRYLEAMKAERLETLEACIKQEKDDEAWAHKAGVRIEPHSWTAWWACMGDEKAPGLTIAEAIHALRAKVEGGAK